MPTYPYACTACGHAFEVQQSFSDPALTECPECSGRLRKVFSSVGVVFKGSGFYRTDSRSGQGKGSSSGATTGSNGSGGDAKPASSATGSSGTGSSGTGSSGTSGSGSTTASASTASSAPAASAGS